MLATAQVMLRWATQRGIAVIPKSNNYDRLAANLQCNTFDLSESDIKKISALNISLRVRSFLLTFKFSRSTHISSVEWPGWDRPTDGNFCLRVFGSETKQEKRCNEIKPVIFMHCRKSTTIYTYQPTHLSRPIVLRLVPPLSLPHVDPFGSYWRKLLPCNIAAAWTCSFSIGDEWIAYSESVS